MLDRKFQKTKIKKVKKVISPLPAKDEYNRDQIKSHQVNQKIFSIQ